MEREREREGEGKKKSDELSIIRCRDGCKLEFRCSPLPPLSLFPSLFRRDNYSPV